MESQPLISVIIPVYNILDCLERCVSSVCAQTYPNLEILLVDDGSTDGTERLCEELAARDSRIRVFHKPNGGSSSARNLGIERARGDYLGFVDSDDYIEPGMYEAMLHEIRQGGYQMVQISRDEIDENGCRRSDVCTPPPQAVFCESEAFMRSLLLHEGDCSFCTKLTDRKLLEAHKVSGGRTQRRLPLADTASHEDKRGADPSAAVLSCILPDREQYEKKEQGRIFKSICGHCKQCGLRAGDRGTVLPGASKRGDSFRIVPASGLSSAHPCRENGQRRSLLCAGKAVLPPPSCGYDALSVSDRKAERIPFSAHAGSPQHPQAPPNEHAPASLQRIEPIGAYALQ